MIMREPRGAEAAFRKEGVPGIGGATPEAGVRGEGGKGATKTAKGGGRLRELMASGRCSNYTVLDNGKLARKDKPPGFYVNQDAALKLIHSGSRLGDPHCMTLVVALRRRQGL